MLNKRSNVANTIPDLRHRCCCTTVSRLYMMCLRNITIYLYHMTSSVIFFISLISPTNTLIIIFISSYSMTRTIYIFYIFIYYIYTTYIIYADISIFYSAMTGPCKMTCLTGGIFTNTSLLSFTKSKINNFSFLTKLKKHYNLFIFYIYYFYYYIYYYFYYLYIYFIAFLVIQHIYYFLHHHLHHHLYHHLYHYL